MRKNMQKKMEKKKTQKRDTNNRQWWPSEQTHSNFFTQWQFPIP